MRRIIFGITSLTLGGAERVLIDIVNELSSKFDITIFTLYGNGDLEKELSSNVKLISLFKKSYNEMSKIEKLKISLKLLFNKKSIYKKYIDKGYETEIAFLEGPITRLFSVNNKNVKKISWVHNDIGKVFGNGFKAKLKRIMDKNCYSKYNTIVFVSNDNKEKFEQIYNINCEKVTVTNYISENRVLSKAMENFENPFDKGKINILTVARLTEQKAIDRLIKMHSKLIKEGVSHMFYCIGDGPERHKLEDMIHEYNVKDTFILLGKRDNPYPYIKNCDVFALLSYYEGFPMTILEAKILGKPILITNTAAREAVENYEKSYITENTDEGVYEGIKHSIEKLANWNISEENKSYENYEIINQIEKLVN